jgi:hypothetical protein
LATLNLPGLVPALIEVNAMLLITSGAVPEFVIVVKTFLGVPFPVPVVRAVEPLNATTARIPVPETASVANDAVAPAA